MKIFQPISISLSPNVEKDDVWLAFKLIFQPWRWQSAGKTSRQEALEGEFKKYIGAKYAFSFNSGRSALMAILDSLSLEKGNEVLLQAFTCNAVPNPIIWSGLKPIFVDCNNDFNINVKDLERKVTPKSKAVIVQHTFGQPTDMNEITSFSLAHARENHLILIEDCAHSLGAEYKNKKVGTFGKAAFFSFSRDKIISSVYGGMAVTDDEELAKKLQEYQKRVGYPSYFWIFQQLLHPVLMSWLILPTYSIFGKYILVLFQTFHILSKAVHWKEKRRLMPGYFPKCLPNALAILASNQFKKLERFNQHRREISQFYYDNLKNTAFELPMPPNREVIPINNGEVSVKNVFLRFAIKHPKAHEIIKKAWQKNLLIGDWYTTPIAPHDTKIEKMGYQVGDCPKAEKLAKITLNLPTHINISKKEAQKIVDFLSDFR